MLERNQRINERRAHAPSGFLHTRDGSARQADAGVFGRITTRRPHSASESTSRRRPTHPPIRPRATTQRNDVLVGRAVEADSLAVEVLAQEAAVHPKVDPVPTAATLRSPRRCDRAALPAPRSRVAVEEAQRLVPGQPVHGWAAAPCCGNNTSNNARARGVRFAGSGRISSSSGTSTLQKTPSKRTGCRPAQPPPIIAGSKTDQLEAGLLKRVLHVRDLQRGQAEQELRAHRASGRHRQWHDLGREFGAAMLGRDDDQATVYRARFGNALPRPQPTSSSACLNTQTKTSLWVSESRQTLAS